MSHSRQDEVHSGVCCDGCEANPIVGARWKCENCGDFDLCETCYAEFLESGKHHVKRHTFKRRKGSRRKLRKGNEIQLILNFKDFGDAADGPLKSGESTLSRGRLMYISFIGIRRSR